METDLTFTKQYAEKQETHLTSTVNDEDIIILDDNSESLSEQGFTRLDSTESETIVDVSNFIDVSNYDEPIDLTSTHNKNDDLEGKSQSAVSEGYEMSSQYATIIRNNEAEAYSSSNNIDFDGMMTAPRHSRTIQCFPKQKGRRRRFEYNLNATEVSQAVQSCVASGSGDMQKSDSKQVEVLKAAKSLFSKRTRTLYHWMYPNAPKAQIKAAVASSWESLGSQEKEFYVSQVLGRFGYPQCNLMINPQLGGIKDLAPLPEGEYKPGTSELQSAISSISTGNIFDMNNPEQQRPLKRKRRPGRPSGSRTRKYPSYKIVNYNISQEFQDDPELSKELEQFALTLNMNNGSSFK